MKRLSAIAFAFSLLAGLAFETSAQSAIYACGHIRRNRTEAIDKLRMSGYATAILFNVTVEEDGSLVTDYNWSTQTPDECGGIICQNGEYTFGEYQPDYIDDIKKLLVAPTSIDRLEICIGGWGNGSYGKIKQLIEKEGTGPESILYRNFKALKEAIPEIYAVNNDQEQDYDVETAIAFHKMMYELGYKTTIAPYTNKNFWQAVVAALNEEETVCDLVYLQTYGGGAGNNPDSWKVFGDIPMHVGFDCEASADINQMKSKFRNWRDKSGVTGGFLWNYNSEARVLADWAYTINQVFPREVETPAVRVFANETFNGSGLKLPEGEFTQPQLSLYALLPRHFKSIEVADGYRATLYEDPNFEEEGVSVTGRIVLPEELSGKVGSVKIEKNTESVDGIASDENGTSMCVNQRENVLVITGAKGITIELYDLEGKKLSEAETSQARTTLLPTPQAGLYLLRSGDTTLKLVVK